MRTHSPRRRFACGSSRGLTAIEALVIVAVLFVVAALLLPGLSRPHPRRSLRAACSNNLKQVTFAALMWTNDNESSFPWRTPASRGGTLEAAASPRVFRHFLAMSNYAGDPKIFLCPSEKERRAARSFAELKNENISYFLNLTADWSTNAPPPAVFGDRHITGGVLSNGFLKTFPTSQGVGWDPRVHSGNGNIAFAEGSVDSGLTPLLQSVVEAQGVRLAIP
jgi:hypothetical protein